MELLFGTNVREYGQHAGKLAGFEIDAGTRRVRKIIFSSNGELGNHAVARPFSSVLPEPGEIDIRPYTPSEEPSHESVVLLSHATRIVRGGREIGRLTGIDVEIGTADLQAITGRKSWLSRRFAIEATAIDLSVPGEIRAGASQPKAA